MSTIVRKKVFFFSLLDRLVYFLSLIDDEKKNQDEGQSEKAEYQKSEE